MNRLLLTLSVAFVLLMPSAWATTYPNPYRETMWNKFTDSMHTIGQSPQQAAVTKLRLRTLRTQRRIVSINHAKRQAWLNGH